MRCNAGKHKPAWAGHRAPFVFWRERLVFYHVKSCTSCKRLTVLPGFMTDFDLLIIGAGPAGSFAAELLAKGGAKVALFDGRPEGEPKACGGGVTAKALNAWPHLLNAVGRTITELDLYSPSSKRLHLLLDEPFAIYSRLAFDNYLRDRARDAGARVISEKISARKTKRNDGGWQ